MSSIDFDHAISLAARRQHGVFSRAQAVAAGGSGRMIDRRVATCRWIRLGPGVYALPSAPPTWLRALAAAQLSSPAAAVAGKAAAALHGFEGFRPCRPAITVPIGANVRIASATVHQLASPNLALVEGLRVLTPIDALLQVAGLAPPARTRLAFDQLLASRAMTVEAVARRFLQWEPGRRAGNPLMRSLLMERMEEGQVPPASVLEGLLYDVLDRPGMPPYVRQHPLPGEGDGVGWVDAAILSSRLILEADGRTWHARFRDFRNDRARDRRAAIAGYRTLRFAHEDFHDRDWVQAQILTAHRCQAA